MERIERAGVVFEAVKGMDISGAIEEFIEVSFSGDWLLFNGIFIRRKVRDTKGSLLQEYWEYAHHNINEECY